MKFKTSFTGPASKNGIRNSGNGSVKNAIAVGLFVVLGTGCVAQDSVLGLNGSSQGVANQTTFDTPVGVQLQGSEVAQIPSVQQEPLPNNVPRPAPRSTVSNPEIAQTTVLAAADPNSAPIPAQRVIQSVTSETTASIGSGLVDPQAPPATVASDDLEPQANPDNVSQPVQPAAEPQATGFFARLFQNSKPSSSHSNTDRKRVTISRGRGDDDRRIEVAHARSLDVSANSQSSIRSRINRENQGSLPGVKSNSQLFGILSNRNKKGSSDTNGSQTQLAAVGSLGRLSPNGLRVQHEKVQVACLKPDILRILKVVERHYGKKPIITSGYRSPKRNRRAGGVKNSMHIFCKAVDIQVEGVSKWDLAKYLRTIPGRGGVGTYCRTKSVHIDTGSVRDWHHPCRRSSKRKRKA